MMKNRTVIFAFALITSFGVVACDDDEDDDDPITPQAEVFVTEMTGLQEVPQVTTTATGDARVEFTPTGLNWVVNVNGIQNVTLAHIHAGPNSLPGANAGVVVNLNPNLTVTTGLLTAGSATATQPNTISMDSLKTLIRRGRAYVNVHNQANGGGHIRGQLRRE